MMGQPSSRSMEDTVLFPEDIPPVSPTRNIWRRRKCQQTHNWVSEKNILFALSLSHCQNMHVQANCPLVGIQHWHMSASLYYALQQKGSLCDLFPFTVQILEPDRTGSGTRKLSLTPYDRYNLQIVQLAYVRLTL